MRVLVACEFSGVIRDAFKALGHEAWSCDLLPSERPGLHFQDDVRHVLTRGWDLMIAHPPCTYLKRWSKVHRAAPGPERQKERSRSYPEIAVAMAAQWGDLAKKKVA